MGKKLLIDATHAEETRVVVADGNKVEDFDFETIHKRQLAGNIYLAKVTRVEPSLQAAFVDYGGNRHGFLAFAEIHPDYYQIPAADREALLAEERAIAREQDEDEPRRGRSDRNERGDRGERGGERNERGDRGERNDRRGGRRRRGGQNSDSAEASAGQEGESQEIETLDLDSISQIEAELESRLPEASLEEIETPTEIAEAGTGVEPFDSDENPAAEAETHVEAQAETPAEARPESRAEDSGLAPLRSVSDSVSGMDVIELGEDDEASSSFEPHSHDHDHGHSHDHDHDLGHSHDHAHEPAGGVDAAARDSEIESVADEDVSDELRPARRPRARRYKIQEVVKVRQIMLVQVVKEERGNKGAALTTYLSLAGRYCVLMPNTARGGGISRKITNIADRKKLKEIAGELELPEGAGLIIRTAGANRTKPEIRRDYEYLSRLWDQIRDLTLKSIAPAPIYEEGDLIKRSIRDLYNKDIDEVLVEGEAGFKAARDFMAMIMPTHARLVKHYRDPMPLFARHQVEGYLSGMFNPTVQLKSGGYIVIGVTEALVAIDVNSGKATRQGSIEETAAQTNLEAADEIARQLRLRDLAGLIVIDFIDMEERRNNNAVEKRLKDALRNDRARIQVGRISGFGLMEMSRQRLRPGMLEATTQPCAHCHGTGLIRSDNSIALTILRALEEEGVRNRTKEVLLKAPIGVVNYLFNQKREHVAQIEDRYGMAVRIEADPTLIAPDFHLEKFKTATRLVRPASPVVSLDARTMSGVDEDMAGYEEEILEAEEAIEAAAGAVELASEAAEADGASARGEEEGGEGGRKKRRRRRRRRGNGEEAGSEVEGDAEGESDGEAEEGDAASGEAEAAPAADEAVEAAAEAGRPKRRRSRRKPGEAAQADAVLETVAETAVESVTVETAPVGTSAVEAGDAVADAEAESDAKPKRRRTRRKPDAAEAEAVSEAPVVEAAAEAVAAPKPRSRRRKAEPAAEVAPVEAVEVAAEVAPQVVAPAQPEPAAIEPAAEAPVLEALAVETLAAEAPAVETEADPDPARPRRSGWWARGR